MNDTIRKEVPIKFADEDYFLKVEILPSGRINQDLLDPEGDRICSFYTENEVTEAECKFFLSGYQLGRSKGHVVGVFDAQSKFLRALGLPVSLLYPEKED